MPLFFFDFRGISRAIDDVGSELAGLAEARTAAVERVMQRLRSDAVSLITDGICHLDVSDHTDRIVFAVNVLALDVPADDEPGAVDVTRPALDPAGVP